METGMADFAHTAATTGSIYLDEVGGQLGDEVAF
jgi:hypothetical protein